MRPYLMHRRTWKGTLMSCLLLLAAAFLLFTIGLSIGSTMIRPWIALQHLIGMGDGEHTFIINTLRLPRMLLALLAGASLGLSGYILQGVIRNPLASPDILGVTSGASAAAITYIVYLSGTLGIGYLPIAAILGAGIISFIIYLLAWRSGVTPIRLVLIGIGIAAGAGAVTTLMLVVGSTVLIGQAYVWMTGSVYGANWGDVRSLLSWFVVLTALVLFFSRALQVQGLGDPTATGLGARVQLHRAVLILLSVGLAGSAVAFVGGIGFVGLIAPHIARALIGRSQFAPLFVTAVVGGLLVCMADVIGRTAFIPLDVPAGVFTAGIGAPFFIYLLFKNRNR
jgi:iron complex transport system permease protein